MSDSSEQVEVLRLIWQELKDLGRNLGGRIDATNARLDETNARLDNVRIELKGEISGLRTELKEEIAELRSELKADHSEMGNAMAESHIRLATEVTTLASEVNGLVRKIVESRADVSRVVACESRIEEIDRRLTQLESARN